MPVTDIRIRLAGPRRRDGRCLHPLRQMRRGLPGHRRRRARSRGARKSRERHRRHHRHPAPRRRQRSGAQLGERLRAFGRMHQGLRLRRQSALPRSTWRGSPWRGQGRRGGAAPQRRRRLSQSGARRQSDFAAAARRCAARAAWAKRKRGRRRPRRRTSCSIPAATCSRRRISRCSRSTSWMRSASAIRVMGGPTHCCGIRADCAPATSRPSGRVRREHASTSWRTARPGRCVSWCPSCHVQFTETTLPTAGEDARRKAVRDDAVHDVPAQAISTGCGRCCASAVPMRIALHRHPGIHGVVEAAEDILRAVPGIEIVDLHQPAVGLQATT